MPKISVIVPVYKVEKYIRRCIDSILAQTFTDFELILVDDGSPDNCPAICDEYAAKDGRIHVIHQENGGLSDARNAGIDWAFANSDSEWLTFIDSDDWVRPEYLERLLNAALENHVAVSVCGYVTTEGEEPDVTDAEMIPQVWSPENFYVEHHVNAIVAWGKLYRKDCFETVRYPVGRIHEDEFTTYRILFAEDMLCAISAPLYFYYINHSGITKSGCSIRHNDALIAGREQIAYFNTHGFLRARDVVVHRVLWGSGALIHELISAGTVAPDVIAGLKSQLRKDIHTFRKFTPIPVAGFADAWEIAYPLTMKYYWLLKAAMRKCKKLLRAPGKLKRIIKRVIIRAIAGIHCMKPKEVDRELALSTISQLHEKTKIPFAQETVMDIGYDLMIIVPVYNAEPFLRQCVDSILTQKTQYTYVAVFVDDGSTDRSGKILDEYALRDNVHVIHQENRGHSGARNRALETLIGRYVMFVDSDDYISDNTVEVLMTEAYKHDADVVEGGLIYFSEDREYGTEAHSQRGVADERNRLTGYPWCKAIRSNLFKDLCFPQGIWFEDTIIKTLLYPKCRVVATVPEIIYHYRKNPGSISHTCRTDTRCLDTFWITKFYLEEMERRNYVFGSEEFEHFLFQCRRNHQRTEKMAPEIRESIFVLECELWKKYFLNVACPENARLLLVEKALKNNNYSAFCYIQNHWAEM